MTDEPMSVERAEDRRSELNALLTAGSIYWWEQKRPVGWTVEQHIGNPEINCRTDAEKKLAKFVSQFISS